MIKKILLTSCILISFIHVFAQQNVIKLVKDINTLNRSSIPEDLFLHKDHLYFTARDFMGTSSMYCFSLLDKKLERFEGRVDKVKYFVYQDTVYYTTSYGSKPLYKTNGTSAGTVFMFDQAYTLNYVELNNKMYFSHNSTSLGYELHYFSSSQPTPQLVKDIYSGSTGSYPQNMVRYGNEIYFTCRHPSYGMEIWKTDGTEAGTKLALDMMPGSDYRDKTDFTVYKDSLYFVMRAVSDPKEYLWVTDGTTQNTHAVKDSNDKLIETGSIWIEGDWLMFSGYYYGETVGYSDGTKANTKRLTNSIHPNVKQILSINHLDGKEYFIWYWNVNTGEDNKVLYTSNFPDGPYIELGGDSLITSGAESIKVGGVIYITAYNENESPRMTQLYKFENNKLILVKDYTSVLPYLHSNSSARNLLAYYNKLIFCNNYFATYGQEIWITDGTEQGTEILVDALSMTEGAYIDDITATPFGVAFRGIDSSHMGNIIWMYDPLKDEIKQVHSDPNESGVSFILSTNNRLYFDFGNKLIYYDYDDYSIHEVQMEEKLSLTPRVDYINNYLLMPGSIVGNNFQSGGIYAFNESTNKLFLTKALNVGNGYPEIYYVKAVGDLLFFSSYDDNIGYTLDVTDGTNAGTKSLFGDLTTNHNSSYRPQQFTAFNDSLLFFAGYNATNHYELFVSDGTETGTRMVKNINTNGSSMVKFIVAADNMVYFSAYTQIYGQELWVSDGTEAGTKMVKNIGNATYDGNPNNLYYNKASGLLYFGADDIIHGNELWVSDGTEAGTRMVKDIYPGSIRSLPHNFTSTEGSEIVYFVCNHPDYGYELWMTDGTEAGTKLVKEMFPGPYPSYSDAPDSLVASGDYLYFIAGSADYGRELFYLRSTCMSGRLNIPEKGEKDESINMEAFIDADGANLTHYWTFGDGTDSYDESPAYAYNAAGDYIITLKVNDGNGCEKTFTKQITIEDKSGVDVLANYYGVNIWPNPTNGAVNIAANDVLQDVKIRLVDVIGKTVYTSNMGNGKSFSVNVNLKPGVYFVKLTSKQGDHVQKVIIQ